MPDNTISKTNIYKKSSKDSILTVAKTAGMGAGVGLVAGSLSSYLPFVGSKYRVGITADTFINAVDSGNTAILPQTPESLNIIDKAKEYLSHKKAFNLAAVDDVLTNGTSDIADVRKLLVSILPKDTQIPVEDDKIAGFIKEQLKNSKPFDEIKATVDKIGGEISESVSNMLGNLKKIKPKDLRALKGKPELKITEHARQFYKAMKSSAKDIARGPIISNALFAGVLAAFTMSIFTQWSSSRKTSAQNLPEQN